MLFGALAHCSSVPCQQCSRADYQPPANRPLYCPTGHPVGVYQCRSAPTCIRGELHEQVPLDHHAALCRLDVDQVVLHAGRVPGGRCLSNGEPFLPSRAPAQWGLAVNAVHKVCAWPCKTNASCRMPLGICHTPSGSRSRRDLRRALMGARAAGGWRAAVRVATSASFQVLGVSPFGDAGWSEHFRVAIW